MTKLEENQEHNKKADDQKRYLAHIDVFEGDDRTKCLHWLNRVQQAAGCSGMPFRNALLAKAGAAVFKIIANTSVFSSDLELKRIVLESFSDVGTASEAAQKLRTMRMTPNRPIISWNHEWGTIHEIAYGTPTHRQEMCTVIEDYINSLTKDTADRVTDKYSKDGSTIKTLQQAMDFTVKVEKGSRQSSLRKARRSALDSSQNTTILDTVNEISSPEVSIIQDRDNDGPLSSTMKSGYQQHGDHRNFSKPKYDNSNNSYRNRRDSGSYSNNPNRSYNGGYRRINKYRHHEKEPRNNIRFEYAAGRGDQELTRVIHKMIEYLRKLTDREREQVKQVQKFLPKSVNEVSEDQIATITIEEICQMLNADINLVYDALVASDYIEQISEA